MSDKLKLFLFGMIEGHWDNDEKDDPKIPFPGSVTDLKDWAAAEQWLNEHKVVAGETWRDEHKNAVVYVKVEWGCAKCESPLAGAMCRECVIASGATPLPRQQESYSDRHIHK